MIPRFRIFFLEIQITLSVLRRARKRPSRFFLFRRLLVAPFIEPENMQLFQLMLGLFRISSLDRKKLSSIYEGLKNEIGLFRSVAYMAVLIAELDTMRRREYRNSSRPSGNHLN